MKKKSRCENCGIETKSIHLVGNKFICGKCYRKLTIRMPSKINIQENQGRSKTPEK